MSIAVLFMIAKTWKQPKCPAAGGQIKKLWDFPGDSAVKNLPASAGDAGEISSPERPPTPQNY